MLWEYIWCVSLLLSFLGLAAVRKNRIKTMKRYMIGIGIFGFGPVLYAAVYYFSEAWQYLSTGDTDDLTLWQVRMYFIGIWYYTNWQNNFQVITVVPKLCETWRDDYRCQKCCRWLLTKIVKLEIGNIIIYNVYDTVVYV